MCHTLYPSAIRGARRVRRLDVVTAIDPTPTGEVMLVEYSVRCTEHVSVGFLGQPGK
jgi:hypothetical protein